MKATEASWTHTIESASWTILLSVVTGVLASWLFWIWITRFRAPKIKWSDFISVNDYWPGGGPKYRIKIQNVGRRAAVDFAATCMLRVPGVGTGGNTKLVHLRTLDVPLPILKPKSGRIITVKTDGLSPMHVQGLPKPLRELLNQDPPTRLEAIFEAFPGAEVVLYLAAYDAVSGTRRHYRSHPYTKESLTDRRFRGDGVEVETRGPV